MPDTKRVCHLILVLAIALTAQVVGSARGQARVAGQMVICSGGAAVTVQVDADGKPIGAPHICPDCAMTLLAAHIAPRLEARRPVSLPFVAWFAPVVPDATPAHRTEPVARGPPVQEFTLFI